MSKAPTWFLHLSITVAVILGIILTVHVLSAYGVGVANRWLEDIYTELDRYCYHYSYDTYAVVDDTEYAVDPLPPIAREKPVWRRLREQCSHTRNMALLYMQMMVYHYVSYYVSLTMAAILAILAGIFLFSITKSGWQEANPYTVTIFLILAGATVFFSQEPSLFEHEKNIAHYTAQFTAYVELERRILRFMANGSEVVPQEPQTNRAAQSGNGEVAQFETNEETLSGTGGESQSQPGGKPQEDQVTVKEFVQTVDQQLSDMNKLLLLFNTGAVPRYTELLNQLDSLSSSTATAGQQ